ncbi:MAG: SPOR domain-containing protein, partial [Alphaproteobacteria bacterium]
LQHANLPRNQFITAFSDIKKATNNEYLPIPQLATLAPVQQKNDEPKPLEKPNATDAYLAGDFETALALWRGAANNGNAEAKYNIGVLYARGDGVDRDNAKALKWYRRAAESGSTNAQYLMGVLYNGGQVVPQDFTAALSWFGRAAAQGHASARTQLALLSQSPLTPAPATQPPTATIATASLQTLLPTTGPIFSTVFPANGWRIQLASLPDEALVPIMWQHLRERHGDVLDGLGLHVERLERSRGPSYEIQVGPVAEKQIAQALCLRLQSQDQDCRVVHP